MTAREVPAFPKFEPIPLAIPADGPMVRWPDGSVRIVGSRVHFWLIARCLLAGESESSVAADFTAVSPEQVHAVNCYIQGHMAETAEYLRVLEAQEAAITDAIEAWQRKHPHPVIERLRATRSR